MAYRKAIEHHHHVDVHIRFDQIPELLQALTGQNRKIMSALDDLTAAVANDTTVDQSAITLLEGLKSALDEAIANDDPAALQALSDQLGANQAALSAAVTANTPATEEPPVDPNA